VEIGLLEELCGNLALVLEDLDREERRMHVATLPRARGGQRGRSLCIFLVERVFGATQESILYLPTALEFVKISPHSSKTGGHRDINFWIFKFIIFCLGFLWTRVQDEES
jgi:hypothetical protein